jgi:hypothetical protein
MLFRSSWLEIGSRCEFCCSELVCECCNTPFGSSWFCCPEWGSSWSNPTCRSFKRKNPLIYIVNKQVS